MASKQFAGEAYTRQTLTLFMRRRLSFRAVSAYAYQAYNAANDAEAGKGISR